MSNHQLDASHFAPPPYDGSGLPPISFADPMNNPMNNMPMNPYQLPPQGQPQQQMQHQLPHLQTIQQPPPQLMQPQISLNQVQQPMAQPMLQPPQQQQMHQQQQQQQQQLQVHQQQQQQQQQAVVDYLKAYTGTKGEFTYILEVRQQPIRARMCGFGDKDRRPITPPPCIRLIIRDAAGKEVDYENADHSFFVLTVDLWDARGEREVNLVRHAGGTPNPSISSSTMAPYPPPAEQPRPQPQPVYTVASTTGGYYALAGPPVGPPGSYGQPSYMPQPGAPYPPISAGQQYSITASIGPPSSHYPAVSSGYGQNHYPNQQPYGMPVQMPVPVQVTPAQPHHAGGSTTGMYTRNLIGSLSVNASRLKDDNGNVGLWFVLQDLSVRTEGNFRLKMNFVDVGAATSLTGSTLNNGSALNKGKAPVLASCFSESFQVYSAKKFPGVIESTKLSKEFARQGIKIPIRKDQHKLSNQAEYDADEV